MAKKFTAKSSSGAGSHQNNKKLAIYLVLSFIVVMTIYFACVRAMFIHIVYVYWVLAAILAILYAIAARNLSIEKLKETPDSVKVDKLERSIKGCMLLLLPIIVTLLADYMLLSLGISGYLGL